MAVVGIGAKAPWWRRLRARMTGFWYFTLAVAIVSLGLSGIGSWALGPGGYCIDEYLPGHAAFELPPYVQQMTSTSVHIRWHTDIPTDGTLFWGETQALGKVANGGVGGWHDATLTGLKAESTYYYRIGSGAVVTLQSFRTFPEASGTITFGVIGDSGVNNDAQTTMANVLAAQEPALVLHTGDVVYPRGADCFYQSRFFIPYQNMLGAVPFYPTLGKHDLLSERGAPYFQAFDLPANNPEHSERFYSFDAGPIHFVSLDSELYHGDGNVTAAQQKAWLIQDLQQTKQPWKVVFLHRLLYSDGSSGGDAAIRADLAPIFARYGVQVVFSGGDHDYERFKPIDGVTYVVTGGGGAALSKVNPGPQTAYAASAYNIVKVNASPTQLTVEAVGANGKVFDRATLSQ